MKIRTIECDCRAGIEGITVHDFMFDERRTRVDWKFCPNCSLLVGVNFILHALPPHTFFDMLERAGGMTFMLHDDFYDQDTGEALQPHSAPFDVRYAAFKGAVDGLPADLASQHEHHRLGTPGR